MENLESFRFYFRGRYIDVKVKNNCIVRIEFTNDPNYKDDMKPVNLEEHPELIEEAISEIEKRYPNYEPGCCLYQAKDWVLYKFKKVL
jgi:hypothetical protein